MSTRLDRPAMHQFYLVLDKQTVLKGSQIAGDDRLEFTELPEELSLTRSANYIDIDIVGRSEPLKSYSNSPSTTFDFSVKFVAVGDPVAAGVGFSSLASLGPAAIASGLVAGGVRGAGQVLGISGFDNSAVNLVADSGIGKAASLELEVHQKVRWLEALTYAQYDDQGRAFPPPAFYLIFGRNLERRCVLRSITEVFKGPWDVTGLMCHVVEVSLTCEEVNAAPKSYQDVRNNVVRTSLGPFDSRFPGVLGVAAVATVSRFIF